MQNNANKACLPSICSIMLLCDFPNHFHRILALDMSNCGRASMRQRMTKDDKGLCTRQSAFTQAPSLKFLRLEDEVLKANSASFCLADLRTIWAQSFSRHRPHALVETSWKSVAFKKAATLVTACLSHCAHHFRDVKWMALANLTQRAGLWWQTDGIWWWIDEKSRNMWKSLERNPWATGCSFYLTKAHTSLMSSSCRRRIGNILKTPKSIEIMYTYV